MTTRHEPPNHDTLTCYTNYRCRRPECVERYNERTRERLQSQASGEWDRLVDAQPVKDHVKKLIDAGGTPHAIMALSGVGSCAIRSLLPPGHPSRIRHGYRVARETAERILAVAEIDVTPPLVNACGTARRAQALVAAGWPIIYLAEPLGFNKKYIYEFLKRASAPGGAEACARTAQRVALAYEDLSSKRPAKSGISKRSVASARRYAASRRWPDVAYWADRMDVIDDPDFEPLYGVTRRELVAQDASWVMRTTGADKTTAAERLGVTRSYIEHAFREYPQYALDTAA